MSVVSLGLAEGALEGTVGERAERHGDRHDEGRVAALRRVEAVHLAKIGCDPERAGRDDDRVADKGERQERPEGRHAQDLAEPACASRLRRGLDRAADRGRATKTSAALARP